MSKLSFTGSHFAAAVAAVLVSYGSAAVIIYQAALSFGSTPEQISSWFTALGLYCGVTTIALSAKYKIPVMMAWCTPGAALMVGMQGIPLSEAIGAFIFTGVIMLFVSSTGLFNRLVALIPTTLACAMLAGILVNFGAKVFVAMQTETLLVLLMLITYFLSKVRYARYSLLFMLIVGFTYAYLQGMINTEALKWNPPRLIWLDPQFNIQTMISVGVPLFITSLVTQNMPAITIMRMHGYTNTPDKTIINTSALGTIFFGPFGAFKVNLAAISSAILMGSDVDPDPKKRYKSAIILGIFYLILAGMGGVVVSVFDALPGELLIALAGIAIFGTLLNNIVQAWTDEPTREASLITLLTSASGITLLGIGSAFWGLVFGLVIYHLSLYIQRKKA